MLLKENYLEKNRFIREEYIKKTSALAPFPLPCLAAVLIFCLRLAMN